MCGMIRANGHVVGVEVVPWVDVISILNAMAQTELINYRQLIS